MLFQSQNFVYNISQSQQIPYEVVPTIEPLHHARDIMIDSQEIGLHAWLLDNVLPDLAHIVLVLSGVNKKCSVTCKSFGAIALSLLMH